MAGVRLEGIGKRFGSAEALRNVDLDVRDGEFLTVFGPSGSGKTTMLRLIAGLEVPDEGRITIDGRLVCARDRWVPPQERGVGMVFQNLALWPHMTATENVAFPLAAARLPRAEIKARVQGALDLVELGGSAHKRPAELSGGEQQRVALARALVGRPAILLMDEPMSSLDARLREKMGGELRRIQQSTGVTMLYVTHDRSEAMTLSDRVAVLHNGQIQQLGSPSQLYRHPRNPLVAAALGDINFLSPTEASELGWPYSPASQPVPSWVVGIRPDRVQIRRAAPDAETWADTVPGEVPAIIVRSMITGDDMHCWLQAGSATLHARLRHGDLGLDLAPGDRVWISVAPHDCILMEGSLASTPDGPEILRG